MLLCSPAIVFSQQRWEKTYGGADSDVSYSVRQTADGGYIVAGWSYFTSTMMDVYLIKTDAWGDTLWTKTYGSPGQDAGESVQQTADGGYIIAGRTGSFPSGDDAYLIRANPQGDTLWARTYGIVDEYEAAFAVQQTRDGGFIMTGVTFVGGSNVWLVKTDSRGDTLWTRNYGGASSDLGRAVQQTLDGGYIVGGWTYSFGPGDGDVYLIKTDSLGDTLWTRTYGSKGPDSGWDVKQTADSGYIVVGGFTDTLMGKSYCYLVKTDANGDTLWTRIYGGPGEDRGLSVQQTADGGYIVSGYTDSFGTGLFDVYLIKTDSSGRSTGVVESAEGRGQKLEVRITAKPNPFTSFASIPSHEAERFGLYDISGRKVGVYRGDRIGWDVSPGVYFLRSETRSPQPDTRVLRIVKLR